MHSLSFLYHVDQVDRQVFYRVNAALADLSPQEGKLHIIGYEEGLFDGERCVTVDESIPDFDVVKGSGTNEFADDKQLLTRGSYRFVKQIIDGVGQITLQGPNHQQAHRIDQIVLPQYFQTLSSCMCKIHTSGSQIGAVHCELSEKRRRFWQIDLYPVTKGTDKQPYLIVSLPTGLAQYEVVGYSKKSCEK